MYICHPKVIQKEETFNLFKSRYNRNLKVKQKSILSFAGGKGRAKADFHISLRKGENVKQSKKEHK